MSSRFMTTLASFLDDGDTGDPELPPGSPPTSTGFSPHEAHAQSAFFGWILPTLRTSEFTILQIVGLDAAVLLSFYKTSFYLFFVCSIFATVILMPINWKNNIGIGGGLEDDESDWPQLFPSAYDDTTPSRDWLDLISDANSYLTVHFLFTYLFTMLALYFLYKNYRRFIRARQLFSLELVHSIPGRTVMVTALPVHLRSERALAEYFESMALSVESVSVCREVSTLKGLLDERTKALLELESAWTKYVGNPSAVESYDPSENVISHVDPSILEGQPARLVVPHRKRPTLRPGWFSRKVDALEHLEAKFKEADEKVRKWRRMGKFKAAHVAFVTFEKMSSAVRCLLENSCLLSYEEIKKAMPWLGQLIDSNDKIRAIVQNSLPSVAMITLNALLPFILEGLTYAQGYKARSLIEYSLMRKYFLFLLVNVVFIFLLASTYWQLVRDLANSPAKIPEKLAEALQKGVAKHFFLSYVVLQGFGIMPLQLLNLGVIIPRMIMRIFVTRTPRDFAELNAPPMINYGVVYPQAILIFVITILYSVVQPLIVVFGAIYFGVGYLVYKYKLLFVFFKPYESQGQAWPITFVRLIWGIVIFQVFMIGILTLRQCYVMSSLLVPLLIGTVAWSWYIHYAFRPLSHAVCLSSVCEVERGEETADVARMREGHPVTWSQRRYAQNDDTLYVAPEDERTDYSQPPMANWYYGVLNTGKRRYGHPALTGVLPEPWLPLKKGETLVNGLRNGGSRTLIDSTQGIVLSLRTRYSKLRNKARPSRQSQNPINGENGGVASPVEEHGHTSDADTGAALGRGRGSGVIILPEDDDWLGGEDDSSDEDYGTVSPPPGDDPGELSQEGLSPANEDPSSTPMTTPKRRHGTYYHHPERRRHTVPGASPQS
ncbi:hypothetical protein ID866_6939 [Astraeus odoratus]|nr:hypothetical protein ID866_6939 [Astraeus odoratus]